jgi:hypothetical protein
MTYDQWKTRDPNDKGFYDMPEDDGQTEIDLAYAEIGRLQDAKRRALAVADERSKENVLFRKALMDIFEVGDGWGPNSIAKPAGTTGEGHAECREIARAALAGPTGVSAK